ncbi:PREDICTED: leucine-rich repeat-containing protein 14 [Tinamus guttatus]|uniref:leucine-rich repeat-containing protein 14 n=1 Tax=Tinamus guttatus TaxID=94827 RepID=UPI00052ED5CD|nr:PREDICTED: leucine-rich repeat-containing protein 14 [Tinamus guttatus]
MATGESRDGTSHGHSKRQRLQLLDVTGLPEDGPESAGPWATTVSLAKACIEVAERQRAAADLRLPYSNVDVRRLPPGADLGGLAAQLGALARLKELNLGSSRLSGQLQLLLGTLQGPLESLELPFCSLLPCDLCYLSQSPHAPALKKLDLSGNNLSASLLQPFVELLVAAAASLLHLDVMECRLRDAQLQALLPPLQRCARLRSLGLFGNPLSMAALRALLLGTAPLPDLRLVVYPYPVDCYRDDLPPSSSSSFLSDGAVDEERLARAAAELQDLLRSAGRADAVWTTSLSAPGVPDCIEL